MTQKQDMNTDIEKWNVESLKEYFSMQFTDLEKRLDDRFDTAEKTTESTRVAMEKRLEGMNEFRNTLKDQTAKFITRDEYETGHKPLEEKMSEKVNKVEFDAFCESTNKVIEDYKINKAVLATKASSNAVLVGYIFTFISTIIGIISLVMRIMGK